MFTKKRSRGQLLKESILEMKANTIPESKRSFELSRVGQKRINFLVRAVLAMKTRFRYSCEVNCDHLLA